MYFSPRNLKAWLWGCLQVCLCLANLCFSFFQVKSSATTVAIVALFKADTNTRTKQKHQRLWLASSPLTESNMIDPRACFSSCAPSCFVRNENVKLDASLAFFHSVAKIADKNSYFKLGLFAEPKRNAKERTETTFLNRIRPICSVVLFSGMFFSHISSFCSSCYSTPRSHRTLHCAAPNKVGLSRLEVINLYNAEPYNQ